MTHDDELAARLRAALKAEAAMVNPGDGGLEQIRSRTGARPWWQHPATLAVAAALVLGVLVGGAAALIGGRDGGADVVANQPDQTSPAPGPTTPSETPSTDAPSPSQEDQQAVWVYYVMDNPVSGPRLYREQHVVPGGPPPAAAAIRELLREPAYDRDYSSAWPPGTGFGYQVEDGTATVELDFPANLASEISAVSAQQIVYTITANDQSIRGVRLRVDGQAPSDPALTGLLERAPMVDVQGLIWLLAPTEGETVDSPVRIEGYGTAFEGTVSWEVRRGGSDEVVADGFTQAGANGEFAEFSDTVELEPGDYEIRAFESSAEDGRPLNVDTKAFTVR